MEEPDDSRSPLKGVRLQGFKGFKLNRNVPLLGKPVFKQTTAKSAAKSTENISTSISNKLPAIATFNNRLSISSTVSSRLNNSSSSSVIASKDRGAFVSPSKTNFKISLDPASKIETLKKVKENARKLEETLASIESPKTSMHSSQQGQTSDSSMEKLSGNRRRNILFDTERPRNRNSRSRSKSWEGDHSRSRSNKRRFSRKRKSSKETRSSTEYYSSKEHRQSRDFSRGTHHRSPKRRRSRSREKSYRQRRQRHSRSPEKSNNKNLPDDHLTPRKFHRTSNKLRSSSGNSKRRSSTSDSSNDDDESMRRMRGQRKRFSKSPETFSSKRKISHSSDKDSTPKKAYNDSRKELNKVKNIADIGIRNSTTLSQDTKRKDKTLNSPSKSTKSKVSIASVGCWLGEDNDDDDDEDIVVSTSAKVLSENCTDAAVNSLSKSGENGRNIFATSMSDQNSDIASSLAALQNIPISSSIFKNDKNKQVDSNHDNSTVSKSTEESTSTASVCKEASHQPGGDSLLNGTEIHGEDIAGFRTLNATMCVQPTTNSPHNENIMLNLCNDHDINRNSETILEELYLQKLSLKPVVATTEEQEHMPTTCASVSNTGTSSHSSDSESSPQLHLNAVQSSLLVESQGISDMDDNLSDSSSSGADDNLPIYATKCSTEKNKEPLSALTRLALDFEKYASDSCSSFSDTEKLPAVSNSKMVNDSMISEPNLILGNDALSSHSNSSFSTNESASAVDVCDNLQDLDETAGDSILIADSQNFGQLKVTSRSAAVVAPNILNEVSLEKCDDELVHKDMNCCTNYDVAKHSLKASFMATENVALPIEKPAVFKPSSLFERLKSELQQPTGTVGVDMITIVNNKLESSIKNEKNIFPELAASQFDQNTNSFLPSIEVPLTTSFASPVANAKIDMNIPKSDNKFAKSNTNIKSMLPAKKRCHEWFKALQEQEQQHEATQQGINREHSNTAVGGLSFLNTAVSHLKCEEVSTINTILNDTSDASITTDHCDNTSNVVKPNDFSEASSCAKISQPQALMTQNFLETSRNKDTLLTGDTKLLLELKTEPQFATSQVSFNTLLPGQQSPESPLFSSSHGSPLHGVNMLDDPGSESGSEVFSPIDIRIPIDNTEGIEERYNKMKEITDGGLETQPDVILSEVPESVALNELSNDSLSDESAKDDTEGRRRSKRIKTIMEQKKRPLIRMVTSNTPTDNMAIVKMETGKESCTKDTMDISLSAKNESVSIKSDPLQNVDPCSTSPNKAEAVPPFEAIVENLYLFEKKKSRARKEIRRMLCECANQDEDDKLPCGDNCLNRLLMIECSSRCPFGDLCTNKRFQRRDYVSTEIFQTSWKGWGLRATENLAPGKLVMEYCGEVLNQVEFERRSQLYSEDNQQHFYFMALAQDEVIDATFKGNASRFINHSCDPNCETQKWTVNGRLRVGFFTIRPVSTGEEITFDYQFERYGKEAQVCYCGSSNCRGYLGKPPRDEDKYEQILWPITSFDLSTCDSEKDKKKSKKENVQEFKENTLENEISRLNTGLHNTKEVLLLSRMMVRCDTTEQRLMCLKVISTTDNQALLRSFLQFHGLPLLWSWMVDVSGTPVAAVNASTIQLKSDILTTLAILPITNKNMLEDSKVLSMVKQWAEEEVAVQESISEEPVASKTEVTSNSTEIEDQKKIVATTLIEDDKEEITGVEQQINEETETENAEAKNATAEKEEEPMNKIPDKLEESRKILALTASLLDAWKDLKEIYRIPKRQKSNEKSQGGDSERSGEDHSTPISSPLPANQDESSQIKSSTSIDGDCDRSPRRSKSRHERDRDKKSDRYRSNDRERRSRRSPPRSRWRYEEERGSRPSSREKDKYSWLYASELNAASSSRLSREEHRRQFERDVRHREKKNQENKESSAGPGIWPQPAASVPTTKPVMNQAPPLMQPVQSIVTPCVSTVPVPSPAATVPPFTPSGYSGNLIQINPAPVLQTSVMYQASHPQQLCAGGMPQQLMYSTPQQYVSAMTSFSQPYMPPTPQQGQPISVIGAPPPQQIFQPQATLIGNPYALQPQVAHNVQLPQPAPLPPPTNTGVTILGSQGGQAIVLLSAEQLHQLTAKTPVNTVVQPSQTPQVSQALLPSQLQPQLQQAAQIVQQPAQQVVMAPQPAPPPVVLQPQETTPTPLQAKSAFEPPEYDVEAKISTCAPHSPPRDPRPPRLPPNWKTASDADGCVYYYHVITRQTQWEPPTWDGSAEDMLGKKGGEMEISTPTHDDDSKKTEEKAGPSSSTVTLLIDQAKKSREVFRTNMSQHIVQCLGAYRKSDCKVGRIVTTEDFKHLARKLTHNILMKEIKQVQVWEDLECNANVKHKAKEYVRKYMAKVGPVYKIKEEDVR